jgi:hypothetical protein
MLPVSRRVSAGLALAASAGFTLSFLDDVACALSDPLRWATSSAGGSALLPLT